LLFFFFVVHRLTFGFGFFIHVKQTDQTMQNVSQSSVSLSHKSTGIQIFRIKNWYMINILNLKHSTLDIYLYLNYIEHDYLEPYAPAKYIFRNIWTYIMLLLNTNKSYSSEHICLFIVSWDNVNLFMHKCNQSTVYHINHTWLLIRIIGFKDQSYAYNIILILISDMYVMITRITKNVNSTLIHLTKYSQLRTETNLTDKK
jgi:hypothetical protein